MGQSGSLTSKLNAGEKDELEVKGYRSHRWKWILCLAAVVLTFGLLIIVLMWRKEIKLAMLYQECPLNEATVLLLKDSYKQYYIEKVRIEDSKDTLSKNLPYSRYFVNKKIKYVWDAGIMQFVKFRAFDTNVTCDFFYERLDGGLEPSTVDEMRRLYGINLIKIVVLPVYKMILKEVSNPFYIFQLYTVVVWFAQQYYDYCSMVIAGTVAAVGASVWETRKQMRALREKVHVSGTITVLRGGVEKQIVTTELVPGDLIYIKPDVSQLLYCDAVLIEGSCSVDESMLTGESYPITKISIPRERMTTFCYQEHRRHILFSGTQLLQGRCEGNDIYIKAVVIRTGFMTGKGELIRAILHPKPIHFRFYQDLVQCAALFFIIGFGGMIYSIYAWIRNGALVKEIILNSLDIVTFVVPPMLPAGLTACTSFAQRRLKHKKIFSLSSRHISLCGGVDVVCFDKTGTLTESDIDLAAAVPIQEGELRQPVTEVGTLPESHPLLTVMTTCHSLIRTNQQLNGYSIDQKMFEATCWTMKEGPVGVNADYGIETPFLMSSPLWNQSRESTYNPTTELAVLKRYPFESKLKRMTVVVQRKNHERFQVAVKGAPETILGICDPVTLPPNLEAAIKHYTLQGYRVLALAVKDLSPHLAWNHVRKLNREELESQVELVGLLIFQNQVKKETLPTIRVLHEARINTVMITGDNLQTAITVAKDCQIINSTQKIIQVKAAVVPSTVYGAEHLRVVYIDPMENPEFLSKTMTKLQDVHSGNFCLTMDGPTFDSLRIHDPSLLEKILVRAKVFARMTPEDKQHLIEGLQRMGRQVAMVGDGCNDCGALRTADAGVSLSMADASMAAPFTSLETNISCIVPLILEGRTTLDAAFGTFQFATGTCFIFFIGVLMLYSISTEPSDFQYFIWDFGIVTIPFFTIGNVKPAEILHKRRPLRHLWGFVPLFSFFTFLMWQAAVLLFGWFYCHVQPWFTPYIFDPGRFPPNPCYEETTIYFLSCMGSIVAAFVFAPSQPYSRHVFSNKVFAAWAVFVCILMTCVMFITEPAFVNWMNFLSPPTFEYTLVIYFAGISGGICCYVWEKYFVRGLLYQWVWPRLNVIRPPRHRYQKLEKQLKREPNWPEMGGDEYEFHEDMNEPEEPNSPTSLSGRTVPEQLAPKSPTVSLRELLDRSKKSFRTFKSGGRRGEYTVNGPKDTSEDVSVPVYTKDAAIELPEDGFVEDDELPPPPAEFEEPPNDMRLSPGVITIDVDSSADEDSGHQVQLLSYRMAPNPSDLSPSRQRRNLNGNAPIN